MHGNAIIDAGVTEMTLWSIQHPGNINLLPEGANVTMRFPNINTSLPDFSFRWPGQSEDNES